MATLASPPFPSTTRALAGSPNRRSNSSMAGRSMRLTPGRRLSPFSIPQLFLCGRHNPVWLEAELSLEFLERCRGPEGLHATDTARRANVTLPSQGGALFHGDTGLHRGRQYTVPILLRLVLEDVPRGHRDHPRADSLGQELLVSLHRENDFTAGRDEDHVGG